MPIFLPHEPGCLINSSCSYQSLRPQWTHPTSSQPTSSWHWEVSRSPQLGPLRLLNMAPKFDVLRGLGLLKVLNVAPELETSMAMPQRGIKFRDIASVGIALLGLYWFSVVFYRVFLSNLAIFPGPKLAAATGWYEAFFDLRSSNFPDVLRSLHEQYGKSRFTHDSEA